MSSSPTGARLEQQFSDQEHQELRNAGITLVSGRWTVYALLGPGQTSPCGAMSCAQRSITGLSTCGSPGSGCASACPNRLTGISSEQDSQSCAATRGGRVAGTWPRTATSNWSRFPQRNQGDADSSMSWARLPGPRFWWPARGYSPSVAPLPMAPGRRQDAHSDREGRGGPDTVRRRRADTPRRLHGQVSLRGNRLLGWKSVAVSIPVGSSGGR
jgi:hypothetical protein